MSDRRRSPKPSSRARLALWPFLLVVMVAGCRAPQYSVRLVPTAEMNRGETYRLRAHLVWLDEKTRAAEAIEADDWWRDREHEGFRSRELLQEVDVGDGPTYLAGDDAIISPPDSSYVGFVMFVNYRPAVRASWDTPVSWLRRLFGINNYLDVVLERGDIAIKRRGS